MNWLKVNKVEYTLEDFQEFMRVFLNKEVTKENMEEVFVTKLEWLKDMHMYYVRDEQKNMNKILRQLTNLDQKTIYEIESFSQRLNAIFARGLELKVQYICEKD